MGKQAGYGSRGSKGHGQGPTQQCYQGMRSAPPAPPKVIHPPFPLVLISTGAAAMATAPTGSRPSGSLPPTSQCHSPPTPHVPTTPGIVTRRSYRNHALWAYSSIDNPPSVISHNYEEPSGSSRHRLRDDWCNPWREARIGRMVTGHHLVPRTLFLNLSTIWKKPTLNRLSKSVLLAKHYG